MWIFNSETHFCRLNLNCQLIITVCLRIEKSGWHGVWWWWWWHWHGGWSSSSFQNKCVPIAFGWLCFHVKVISLDEWMIHNEECLDWVLLSFWASLTLGKIPCLSGSGRVNTWVAGSMYQLPNWANIRMCKIGHSPHATFTVLSNQMKSNLVPFKLNPQWTHIYLNLQTLYLDYPSPTIYPPPPGWILNL